MKKLSYLILALAAATATAASAGEVVNNWKSANGEVWKSAQDLCWRDGSWTAATAASECDGALQAPKETPPPPPPPTVPAVEPPPPPAPAPAVVSSKVTFQAETLFDFDKYALKPTGKEALNALVAKLKDINLEVVVATGYTDWTGAVPYNKALSLKRAESVKAYLLEQGIPAAKVFVEGKGKTDFIATNSTKEGRAKNRRVQIEVVGTTTTTK